MRHSVANSFSTRCRPTHCSPRNHAWLSLAFLLMHAASGCAPVDPESLEGELSSFDEDADLDDKGLPSAGYEAESRTAASGCNTATNYSGYTGAGFIDFGGNGTWIEWNNIAAPMAGQYSLRLRYANGASANRAATILVNGSSVATAPFAITGSWESWATASVSVSLRAGNNTIRVLASASTGGPNLDRMDVVATDLCPSDPSKVEPGACGCGVPEGACGGSGSCAVANEHSNLTLSCSSGQTISAIQVASYGLPSGSCPSGFQVGACHASTSKQQVEAACLGKQSCSIAASNSVFGDPCSGQAKRLGVVYACRGSDPGGTEGALFGRPSGTKVRIGSWNNFRGSVFPKTDAVWRAINNSAKDEAARVEGGARVFKALKADIWLLQETAYSDSGPPAGVTVNDINNKLAQYMGSLTGDTWSAKCNGKGLCTLIRGGLRFAESWNPHHRVAGNRVILADGSKVLLINVHYMNKLDQAQDTVDIVKSAGSSDDAVFVGGDFNNTTTGPLYSLVATIPEIKPLTMFHSRDADAIHLADTVARAAPFTNTGGQVAFGSGPAGQDVVTSVNGGQIDHFFLRSDWGAQHRFVLNSFLLSPKTLAAGRMTPLDVALEPEFYQTYFRDFASKGIVYELPSDKRGIGHDHLPMFVDFTSP